MRVTISIADELLAAAKERARAHGQALDAFVEDALQRELNDGPAAARSAPPVPVFSGGSGAASGIDLNSNSSLLEALDSGFEPGERR